MRRLRWILLSALLLPVGCDAAAIAWLMGDKNSDSDDGSPIVAAGSPVFKVWVASIPNASAADDQLTALIAAGGQPSSPMWTDVGNAAITSEFGPFSNPTSINAILVQASSDQNYQLDCVEILGSQGEVLEYASGATWSNRVDFPDRMIGAPDGSSAVTNAVVDGAAVIFTLYSGPILKFRINGQGVSQPPASGDTVGEGSINTPGEESPGGAAPNPGLLDGLIDVPISVGVGGIYLARFDPDGNQVDGVQVASGVTASEGSESVAADSDGSITVAATVGDGQVQVRRFDTSLNSVWSVLFSSGLGGDRVDTNGIAIDSDGNIVVSGGRNSVLTGVSHWMTRLSSSGAVQWEQNSDDDVSGPTYWRGVAIDPGGLIVSSGDLNPALVGGANEVRTARRSPGGVTQWSKEYAEPGSPSNLGRAVAVDSSGTIHVGGYLGTSNQGRNGVLLKYSSAGDILSVAAHNGPANGDDEILDVAVDADGSVYAVGYETAPGQGENMWIRKYAPNNATVWTRTYDGGHGNDRAVSVVLLGSRVYVAGWRTNASGQKKFVLRIYAK